MEETIVDISVNSDKTLEADQTEAEQTEEVRTEEDPVSTEAPAEDQPKGSKDFSPEERATIIAMAKEVGFAKVADEFGIKARQISYWVQQEKKKESKALKPSKAKASVKDRSSSRTLVREVAQPEDTPTVAAVPTEPVKVIEPLISDKPAGRKTVSAEPAGSVQSAERSEEKRELNDRQSLMIENAILKERVSALTAEIEKLRAALTSLM